MQEITIERTTVNVAALDSALRTALGNVTTGLTIRPGLVIVHLLDSATPEQIQQVRQIVLAHDPSQLTLDQQLALQRQQQLDQARQSYGAAPLDLTLYDLSDETLRRLAQKIYWLEREIAALR